MRSNLYFWQSLSIKIIVKNNDFVFIIPKIKSLHRETNNTLGGFIAIPFGTSISYQTPKG
jgi:hypothetical protein